MEWALQKNLEDLVPRELAWKESEKVLRARVEAFKAKATVARGNTLARALASHRRASRAMQTKGGSNNHGQVVEEL